MDEWQQLLFIVVCILLFEFLFWLRAKGRL